MNNKPQKKGLIGASVTIIAALALGMFAHTRSHVTSSSSPAPASSNSPAVSTPPGTPHATATKSTDTSATAAREVTTGSASIAPCIILPKFFAADAELAAAAGDCSILWGARPDANEVCGADRTRIFARSLPGRRVIAVRCQLAGTN